MSRAILAALAIAVVLGGACGDAELKAAGEPCVASAECAAGLVCDLVRPAPVCADHLTSDARVIDAAIDAFVPIDAGPDGATDAAIDAAISAAGAPGPGS